MFAPFKSFYPEMVPTSVEDHPQCFPVIRNAWLFNLLSMKHLPALPFDDITVSSLKLSCISKKTKKCSFSQIYLNLFLSSIDCFSFLGLFLYPVHLFIYFPTCFPAMPTWELKCFCHTRIEGWKRWFTPVTKECKGDVFIETRVR